MLLSHSSIEAKTPDSDLSYILKPISVELSYLHDDEGEEGKITQPVAIYPSNYVRYDSSSSVHSDSTNEIAHRQAGRKKVHRVSDDFSKKYENVRQSVIRFFKKNIRKLLKIAKPALSSKRNPNRKSKPNYKNIKTKLVKQFHQIFNSSSPEDAEEVFEILISMDDHRYFDSQITGIHGEFRSCNDSYVRWFFGNENVLRLYQIHDKYCQSEKNYEKILKINNDDLCYLERIKLYNFIYNIPQNYRDNKNSYP